ncbi:MAG: response regulator [Phycisphaerales bacterium]|nr:response regulator [Phycisphaerales bacterium]
MRFLASVTWSFRIRPTATKTIACCLLALATFAAPAPAQTRSGVAPQPSQLLEDFVHYTRIAKVDLATGYGQELLDSGVTNAQLAVMVEEAEGGVKRFDEAIGRALMVAELEDIAAEVARRVETGRLDLARDADRIEEAIKMLTGTQRQKLLATGRLKAAGEYAVPALLREITDGRDDRLALAAQSMISTIGLDAVTPLCEALPAVHPDSQLVICNLLGDIRYAHAAPFLRSLAIDRTTPGPVARAADRAFAAVGATGNDIGGLFAELAEQYYAGSGSLVPYPNEPANNVWSYDEFVGLAPTPVPTAIFNEVMAMRRSAQALAADPTNRLALGVFVAADLKRENDLPEGADDPVYGASRYSPDFYATVFGTGVSMDVLARAIDTNDTRLVRDAIAALSKTTGGSNLFGAMGRDRRPLLEALSYPDRRVQYDAALTLAHALPEEGFDGDYRVVPILAGAVQAANQSFAVIVADDDENRRQAARDLEALGFTIAAAEPRANFLAPALAETSGVDLAVVRMRVPQATQDTVESLRTMPQLAAVPVLVLASTVDEPLLRRELGEDPYLRIARPGLGATRYEAVLDELLRVAMGGRMTEAESEAYAFESLGALEDIAIACSPAYAIKDAESALLDAMESRTGRARLLVAGILARIESATAQQKLFDAALAAGEGEQIDLLTAVADSVKRFGNRAEPRHIAGLLALVADASGSTAEAAARVHGALNITSTDAVKLITAAE